jgi:hypothetical protein
VLQADFGDGKACRPQEQEDEWRGKKERAGHGARCGAWRQE